MWNIKYYVRLHSYYSLKLPAISALKAIKDTILNRP